MNTNLIYVMYITIYLNSVCEVFHLGSISQEPIRLICLLWKISANPDFGQIGSRSLLNPSSIMPNISKKRKLEHKFDPDVESLLTEPALEQKAADYQLTAKEVSALALFLDMDEEDFIQFRDSYCREAQHRYLRHVQGTLVPKAYSDDLETLV